MSIRGIARVTDMTTHGPAIATSAQIPEFVFNDNLAVAVQGATVPPHYYGSPHPLSTLINNLSDFIYINDVPIALKDSSTSCGTAVVIGSLNTFGD